MTDIVTMLVSAIVSELEDNTSLGTVNRAPMAEIQDSMEDASIATVFVNDPDDDEWAHELERPGEGSHIVGGGSSTHRPWVRRFTVKVRYVFTDATRATAVSTFSNIMREIESVFSLWSSTVGPDDNGETMNRACEMRVESHSDYSGGETEFLVSGKVRVAFHTT